MSREGKANAPMGHHESSSEAMPGICAYRFTEGARKDTSCNVSTMPGLAYCWNCLLTRFAAKQFELLVPGIRGLRFADDSQRYLVTQGPLFLHMCILQSIDDTLYLVGHVGFGPNTINTIVEPSEKQVAMAQSYGITYASKEAVLVKAAR